MQKLELKEIPKDISALPIDMAHPNRTLIHGCYRETIQVGGRKREFLTYIPKDLEYCQPCLVVAPPSDADPLAYLQTSGLRQLAEEKQLYVHLMVSGGEPWATDGSGADFMNAVYVAIQGRDYYVTMQDNIYACGMGDGAVIAHQAAQKMASEWSGLFTFGALSVPLDSRCGQQRASSGTGRSGVENRCPEGAAPRLDRCRAGQRKPAVGHSLLESAESRRGETPQRAGRRPDLDAGADAQNQRGQ